MASDRYQWRKFKSNLIGILCFAGALATILPLGLVFFHLVREGFSSIDWNFFTRIPAPVGETGGGVANAIVGTLVLLSLASLIGIPAGVLGGVYLAEYGTQRANWVLRFVADVLNGVPSIIWGIVAYGLLVAPFGGFSAYAGGFALGIMMTPLIMRTTEEVLLLVPGGYREAALALGIPQWRVITQIVMRTATKGIVTGVLLALARISGETAPLLFTALGNSNFSRELSQPIAALPLQIFSYAISPYEEWQRQAWAGALLLVTTTFLVNFVVRVLTRGKAV